MTPTTSLQALHPELASEWHPTKNSPLKPEDVRPGSNKKVWWLCPRDSSHEWWAVINSRSQGNGCPMCAGQMATPVTSLKALYAEIAAEWHPTNNLPLTSDDVRPRSNKKVWWLCTKDRSHTWQSTVSNRTAGNGCPVCSGKMVTRTNSFKALYPELAAQWHPTRNHPLTADEVRPKSGRKVWWQCSKEETHQWQATVADRTEGGGCPMCSGRRASPTTSLKALYPEISVQWHETKNDPLTPNDVVPGSEKQVWWQCATDRSHIWQTTVAIRTAGNGCPMCSGRIVTPTTSLQALFPHLAGEWHPTRNAPLTPQEIVPGSNKRVWWQCANDSSHDWQTTVNHRRDGTGCPMCSGQKVTSTTSLRAV